MNIASILREKAEAYPDEAAIIDFANGSDRVTSFAELELYVRRAAESLEEHDIGVDDTVLILQPMAMELYAALLAVFRVGAVAMFLDPSAARGHLAACCRRSPPHAFIGSSRAQWLRLLQPALREIPHLFSTAPSLLPAKMLFESEPSPREVAHRYVNDPALITFTSGSTAEPKAAVRTHGFLLAQHHVLERNIHLDSGQIDLTTLPVFGLANLASSLTTLIPNADLRRPGFIDPKPVARQIQRWTPSRTAASPAFLDRLLDGAEPALSGFHEIYTGGAPVFPSLLRRLSEEASEAEIVAVYGSTEAEPIAHVGWTEISQDDLRDMRCGKGLLAGRAVAEIDLRILPDRAGEPIGPFSQASFESETLGADEPGEIVVTGDHVLRGYLEGHGDEETKFRVEDAVWHRTGDAGYLDTTGRLWLLGRCGAKIVDAEGTLYPFAVECAAMQFEFVRRCALVPLSGQRILVIELRKAASPSSIDHLRHSLAWAKLGSLRIIKRIPVDRRHNAKIDYPALTKKLGT